MSSSLEVLIVTGMSGAGKSKALDLIEDIDYYCVDNMPPELIPKFVELCKKSGGKMQRVAIGADIRSMDNFNELLSELKRLSSARLNCKILFMDAATHVLVKRFKETRRPHPLEGRVVGSIEEIIERERQMLAPIYAISDFIIDTSSTTTGQLWNILSSYLLGTESELDITVLSFGYKYGLPAESDFVFDMRCLPNPFYIDALRHKTGQDKNVREFVFSNSKSGEYLDMIELLVTSMIPLFAAEGRATLIIALGCTGGRHRSVALAEKLTEDLIAQGKKVTLRHRDIDK